MAARAVIAARAPPRVARNFIKPRGLQLDAATSIAFTTEPRTVAEASHLHRTDRLVVSPYTRCSSSWRLPARRMEALLGDVLTWATVMTRTLPSNRIWR